MGDPQFIALGEAESFRFDCNRSVPCFNQCCRDLNQALTPYDVLRLRSFLKLSWPVFLERHAVVTAGPVSGLPIVSLRFADDSERRCPFVAESGCRVYAARPTSCRLYPLARVVRRTTADGRTSEHYAVLTERHCRGFEQAARHTARQWVAEQGAEEGLAAGDRLMDVIALKNRTRPGPLSPVQLSWVTMAFYDLDRLKQEAGAGHLPGLDDRASQLPADLHDEAEWLEWGLTWLARAVFVTGG